MKIGLAGKAATKKLAVEKAQAMLRDAMKLVYNEQLTMWVRAFFMRIGDAPLVCVDGIVSIVPEQPWGLRETTRGAEHRASEAERLFPGSLRSEIEGDEEIFIGIENGVWETVHNKEPDLCRYADAAVVAARYKGKIYHATSEGISFPTRYVRQAMESADDITVGKIIAKYRGGDHANPHKTLTHGLLDRSDILARAVFAALVQIEFEE